MLPATQRPLAGAGRKACAAARTPLVGPAAITRPVMAAAHTSIGPQDEQQPGLSRRDMIGGAGALGLALAAPGAASAAKAPRGFNVCEDRNDGYKFVYPFGWQEVAVTGADVVFKDIVEPLESVSVTMAKTERGSIAEFGEIQEVAETLAKDVLTAPGQEVKVLATNQREANGRLYYEFEFTASTPTYNRHQLAVVTAANNTFYTLTTGANERRWPKMKDRLEKTVHSFTLLF